MDGRTTFPPAGIVIERRHLVEAELLVVIGADPFRRVDRALFQRRIDVATGDLLRHDAQLLQHLARKAANPELQALQIGHRVDFLAEPTTHLHAGIAAGQGHDVMLGKEFVIQIDPAAVIVPRVDPPRRKREGHRRSDRPGRILAPVIVTHRVAGLDIASRHLIGRLQTGHQFTGCKDLNLEIPFRSLGHHPRQHFRPAIDRIQRFRERRRQAPGHLGGSLGNGRRGKRGCPDTAHGGLGQE